MTQTEFKNLIKKAQYRDQPSIEKIIKYYDPLISQYANTFIYNNELNIVDKDDLIQEARIAIYNSIPNFKSTNVPILIYRAMVKYINGYDNAIHMPYYIYYDANNNKDLIDSRKVTHLEEDSVKISYEDRLIDHIDQNILINKIFNKLTPKQADVLYLKYGKEYTNHKIGKMLGLSHERIRQISYTSLKKIKRLYNIKDEEKSLIYRYNKKKHETSNEENYEDDFNIFYMDIDLQHEALVDLLEHWYNNVFMKCFTFPNEIEFLDNIKEYLAKNRKSTEYEYHVIVMVDNRHTILGGCIYDYFYKSNIGVIEYLAINPNLQNRGYGTKLYKKVSEDIIKKHYKLYEENDIDNPLIEYKLPLIFCEINDPKRVKDISLNYLYFWNKLEFKYIDMFYIQPSLSETQKPVSHLKLIVNSEIDTIDKDKIRSFLHDYMKYSMSIDNPFENKYYQFMMRNIRKSKIELYPIVKEN